MAILSGVSSKASMVLLGERTAKKRGIIPTIASGAGVDVTLRAIDNLVGGNLQRFAGFNVPFVGNVGVIDAITFLIFSAGGRNIKGGVTAVVGAKVITGSLPSVASIIPGNNLSVSAPVANGALGAPQ